MLEVAQSKSLYRKTIEGDLLAPLPIKDHSYGGITSSGTFTHGHVGPACLPELLRITRRSGLFVCGVVPEVYDRLGFGSALAQLQAAEKITPIRFSEITLYEGADHEHAHDKGLVMIFRKL